MGTGRWRLYYILYVYIQFSRKPWLKVPMKTTERAGFHHVRLKQSKITLFSSPGDGIIARADQNVTGGPLVMYWEEKVSPGQQ